MTVFEILILIGNFGWLVILSWTIIRTRSNHIKKISDTMIEIGKDIDNLKEAFDKHCTDQGREEQAIWNRINDIINGKAGRKKPQ